MEIKWIGAVLIVAGCGGYGIILGSEYRTQEKRMYQLLRVLEYMESDLRYRLTPLPDLCRRASVSAGRTMKRFFHTFAELLETRISPDASSCMRAAIDLCDIRSQKLRLLLADLGNTLGQFDLEGQLKGLCQAQRQCASVLQEMRSKRELRLRSYYTLGFCAGLALAIVLI